MARVRHHYLLVSKTSLAMVLMVPVVVMLHTIGRAEGFLPSTIHPRLTSPCLTPPCLSRWGTAVIAHRPRKSAIARHESITRMTSGNSLSQNSSSRDQSEHPGSSSVTREEFLAGTAAIVTASLASRILTIPSAPPSYDVAQERIFDTRKTSFLPADPARLIVPGIGFSERVVCLGETHTNPMHHRMQFNVMKATHAVTKSLGEPLAIGLEMFYRQQQAPLDRYIFNHGDLRTLKLETKWDQTWGFDFNQYAKIFRYAREEGIRLVGLNAPESLVNLVYKVGMVGLPKKIREVLPEMDLGQAAHRQRFVETIEGFSHGAPTDKAVMGRMYEAQTLWDEYMAETASKYLKRVRGRMVLLAGNGHVQARDGIPDRIERRTGLKPFTVVPVNVEWTAEGLPDIDHPPGKSFADWIYFTQPEIGLPLRGAGSASAHSKKAM